MTEIKLKRRCKYAVDIYPELLEIGLDMEKACDFLNRIKDADVAEVRRGEWKIKTDEYDCEYMMCSVCKEEFYPTDTDTVDTMLNFCPYCGADMRGETNDNRAEN